MCLQVKMKMAVDMLISWIRLFCCREYTHPCSPDPNILIENCLIYRHALNQWFHVVLICINCFKLRAGSNILARQGSIISSSEVRYSWNSIYSLVLKRCLFNHVSEDYPFICSFFKIALSLVNLINWFSKFWSGTGKPTFCSS